MGRRYSVAFSCIIEPCSAKPGKVEDTYNHGFRSAILTEADSAYSLICYVSILEVANLSYNVIVDDWSGMPYPTVDERRPLWYPQQVTRHLSISVLPNCCNVLFGLIPPIITPVAKLLFKTMTSTLGGLNGLIIGQLLNPKLTDIVLNLLGERGRVFDPLLHNTVNATVLHGSDKFNVIPSEVSVELDARLLPGFKPEDMIAELRQIIGQDVELEVLRYDPGPDEPDMGLFDKLADILKEFDPKGIPVPLLLSGASDARFFSRLGIQTYGFLPMPLPEDFNFSQTIHAADERIPMEAVDFGTNAIFEVLKRFE